MRKNLRKIEIQQNPESQPSVSWFKSSLLLRIQIKYTHKLQFFIKTKDSIFNRNIYTTDERRKPSMAWLVFLRQTLS